MVSFSSLSFGRLSPPRRRRRHHLRRPRRSSDSSRLRRRPILPRFLLDALMHSSASLKRLFFSLNRRFLARAKRRGGCSFESRSLSRLRRFRLFESSLELRERFFSLGEWFNVLHFLRARILNAFSLSLSLSLSRARRRCLCPSTGKRVFLSFR